MGDSYLKKGGGLNPPQPIKFSVLLFSSASFSPLSSCRPQAGIRAGQGSLCQDLEKFLQTHTHRNMKQECLIERGENKSRWRWSETLKVTDVMGVIDKRQMETLGVSHTEKITGTKQG